MCGVEEEEETADMFMCDEDDLTFIMSFIRRFDPKRLTRYKAKAGRE